MSSTNRIDDLKTMPIKPLLWRYALPAIIGSTVNALYNIISRFYIGHADYLGDAALSAVGIALPIMILISAFGMLVGVGAASRISIYLGDQDKHTAERVLGTAFVLIFMITLPLSLGLLYFLEPIVVLLKAEGKAAEYTYDFLVVFLPGTIFSTLCFSFNNMMRASGYPTKAMYTMLMTLVLNAILSPIFIYYYKWGVKGAALAVVISMVMGAIFVLDHFIRSSETLKFRWKNIRFDLQIVKAILSIGMSPFFMILVSSSVVFLMIQQANDYGGEVGVATYTIVNAMLMLMVMILVGLTQGMQPIVGYCYGARKTERMRSALMYTIKIGVVIGAIGMLIGLFLPQLIVLPFNPSDQLAESSISALKIVMIMFPLVGFQIVVTSYFQSIGKVGQSIFLSLSRQLLFLVPALIIFPLYFDIDGVWMAIPVADFIAAIAAGILLFIQLRALKKIKVTSSILLKKSEE